MPILFISNKTNKTLPTIENDLDRLRSELYDSDEPLHLIFASMSPNRSLGVNYFAFGESVDNTMDIEDVDENTPYMSESAKKAYRLFLTEHAKKIECVKIYMHELEDKTDITLYIDFLERLTSIKKLVVCFDYSDELEESEEYYNTTPYEDLSYLLSSSAFNPEKIKILYLDFECFSPHPIYDDWVDTHIIMEHQWLVHILDFIQRCIYVEKISFTNYNRQNGVFFDKLIYNLSGLNCLNELHLDVFGYNVTTLVRLFDNRAIKDLWLELSGSPYWECYYPSYLVDTHSQEESNDENDDYDLFIKNFQQLSRAIAHNYTLRELSLDLSFIEYDIYELVKRNEINPFLLISYNQSLKTLNLSLPRDVRVNWNNFSHNFSKNNIAYFDFQMCTDWPYSHILTESEQEEYRSSPIQIRERCAKNIEARQEIYQALSQAMPEDKYNIDPRALLEKIASAERGSYNSYELLLNFSRLKMIFLEQQIYMSMMLFIFLIPFHHENQKYNGKIRDGDLVNPIFTEKFANQWYPLFFGAYLPFANEIVVNIISYSTIEDLRRLVLTSTGLFGKCKHQIDAEQQRALQNYTFLKAKKKKSNRADR